MKIFRLICKIIITLCVVMFFCFQYFGYSSKPVDDQLHKEIQEKYHLNLTDINWRIEKYTKNTLINAKPAYYHITNSFLTFEGYSVSIQVTEGDEIFEEISIPSMLSKSISNQVMIEKQISHNNIDMTVQILETEPDDFIIEYTANYRIIVVYDDCLYHFDLSRSPSITYSINSTEIHEDELSACLNIIDEFMLYE